MSRTLWLSRDLGYGLLAASLGVLILLPALLRPEQLIYPSWSEYSDLVLIHWPKIALVRDSLVHGQGWPLWSPYQLSGQPLAANQLAMLFYPPALLLVAGPAAWTAWLMGLFLALHLAWAGAGTYCLARCLGRRPEAALLAAAAVALSGKLLAHTAIGHASLVPALSWAPWALAFLHRALTRRSLGWALLAGVALAAQAATHSYALIYTTYGLAVYGAVFLLLAPAEGPSRLRSAVGHLARMAAMPLVALLLGAAQLLPLLEMAAHSNRSLSLAEATLFSLSPPQMLAGLLFPAPSLGHEWTFYPGLLPVGLAAAALLGRPLAGWRRDARHEWPVVALALLVVAGVLLSLGGHTPFYGLAYRLLPGLSWVRTPARLWLFATLGIAVLAAYGLENWETVWRRPRQQRAARRLLVAASAAAPLLSLGAAIVWDLPLRATWGLAVFGLLSGALLLWAARGRPNARWAWLAILVAGADLASFDWTLLRLVPLAPVSAAGREPAAWLAAQDGPWRSYSPSFSLPQPAASQAGVQQIDGVEPVHLAAYDRFMARAGGYGDTSFGVTIPPFPDGIPEEAAGLAPPDLGLLGALNGRYLASAFPLDLPGLALRWQGAGTWIYENDRALPRALVVHRAEPAGDELEIEKEIDRLAGLDLRAEALVAGRQGLAGPAGSSPARLTAYAANRVQIQSDLDRPGLLVLSEIYYPGWQALDNGRPAPIVRTNGILRGVYLEPGSHEVEFRYRPWTVCAGLALSAATAVALLAYAGLAIGRRT